MEEKEGVGEVLGLVWGGDMGVAGEVAVEGVAVVPFTGMMKEWLDWDEAVSEELGVSVEPVRVMPEMTIVGWTVTVW